MKLVFTILLIIFSTLSSWAQTKIGGHVVDENNQPVSFATVLFLHSYESTITDENGKFYLTSKKSYDSIQVSFIGFKTKKIALKSATSLHMHIVLTNSAQELATVKVYSGKTPKKNNPAIDILRKIWNHERRNGVNLYNQYQYNKYEKIEFDINNVDSSMIHSKLFKGMRFIFNNADTSRITGKAYLPFFLTETASKIYGDNVLKKKKGVLLGHKNPPGFTNNHAITDFINELYTNYNIYDNYLKIYDKSFVSPLSKTGINVYNYVLADSAFIKDKWCYRIVYYPRRKNELTFKGDFWVNDTTWAIKKIELTMSKNANINWVNDVYIEQEYDVLNDSTFVISRDHFMTNFALHKKEDVYGLYGKRTTLYDNYRFNIKKPAKFYKHKRALLNKKTFNRNASFWKEHRIERLSKNEKGVYEMLDTLKNTHAFKRMYNIGSILASGYINYHGFDFGPIPATMGYNNVEGFRLRLGGRTYFTPNDMWRIQGYGAYGFKDQKFKYGLEFKWLIDPRSRLKLTMGTRRDIQQLGINLTRSDDILGRSLASNSFFSVGSNNTLSEINISRIGLEISPFENFRIKLQGSYRTLKAASKGFNLDYYLDKAHTKTASEIKQAEMALTVAYTPGREVSTYGVDRIIVNKMRYAQMFLTYTHGFDGFTNRDFDFDRLSFFYRQPIQIGGFGYLTATLELGKTFGAIPLGLLSIVPGNETLLTIHRSFPLLNYYEFVTDTYASLHLEHNFGGRIFSRIPIIRNWNLREIVGIQGIIGSISDENQALNASTSHPILLAPNKHVYWAWNVGVGNIFKFFRIDFHFRGDYFNNPNAQKFGVTGTIEIAF